MYAGRVAFTGLPERRDHLFAAFGQCHVDQVADNDAGHVPQTHLIWMLIQWRIRLLAPAAWNENVTVRTWPRTMERVTSDRDFEIIGEDGRRIAIGTSSWVLVSSETGRIVRIPKEVSEAYALTPCCVFDDCAPEVSRGKGSVTYACVVQHRDIDTNRHVNNRVYLQYADEALGGISSQFSEVLVRYKRQLLLGEKVQCFVLERENRHSVEICTEDGVTCAAVVYK